MNSIPNNSTTIACPECDTPLTITPSSLLVGSVVECPSCGTESEVVTTTPFKLYPLEEEK